MSYRTAFLMLWMQRGPRPFGANGLLSGRRPSHCSGDFLAEGFLIPSGYQGRRFDVNEFSPMMFVGDLCAEAFYLS